VSTSLTIYPLYDASELKQRLACPWARIRFELDYRIFGQLREDLNENTEGLPVLPAQLLPRGTALLVHEDDNEAKSCKMKKDSFGDPLTFINVGDLKNLVIPTDATKKNKAIFALIKKLPKDMPVVLYWS
jgi:hypothetical protein